MSATHLPVGNTVYQPLQDAEQLFIQVAQRTGLDFGAEVLYAVQALELNKRLREVARRNPTSLKLAMINVGTAGLTLNPALQLAYLVPRKGRVTLDISYRGLRKLAKDSGAILWAKVELVFSNDDFVYQGMDTKPTHDFDPFAPEEARGTFRGGYCVAKLPDGESLVETMSAEAIADIEALSRNDADEYSPWNTRHGKGEMRKKTILKRASKSWTGAKDTRFQHAVDYLNREGGEGLRTLRVIQGGLTAEPAATLSDDEVDERWIAKLDKVIDRAQQANAWSAARQYIAEQFPAEIVHWAYEKLSAAETRWTAANAQDAKERR